MRWVLYFLIDVLTWAGEALEDLAGDDDDAIEA